MYYPASTEVIVVVIYRCFVYTLDKLDGRINLLLVVHCPDAIGAKHIIVEADIADGALEERVGVVHRATKVGQHRSHVGRAKGDIGALNVKFTIEIDFGTIVTKGYRYVRPLAYWHTLGGIDTLLGAVLTDFKAWTRTIG